MTEPTPATPATGDPQDVTESTQPKPTETVDYWKQRSRENESKAKANADAAKRLAEIEESQKTEAQKTADRLAAAEKDAADARREALRLRIASRFQIGDEDADLFLTGDDEATLTKQAERLTARESERKKQGNHVAREGNTPSTGTDEKRAFAQQIFDNAG
jgi:hypothetical protein